MRNSTTVIVALAVALGLTAGALLYVISGSRSQKPAPSGDELAAAQARMPPEMTFSPVFEPCAHCHEIGNGARTSTGPVLNGVIGRKAGARDDYPYSQAMTDSDIVWTEANLRQFLKNPDAMVPGTRMRVGGFAEKTIQPLIGFLKTAPAK